MRRNKFNKVLAATACMGWNQNLASIVIMLNTIEPVKKF